MTKKDVQKASSPGVLGWCRKNRPAKVGRFGMEFLAHRWIRVIDQIELIRIVWQRKHKKNNRHPLPTDPLARRAPNPKVVRRE
jgi:hypothetical protein